MAAGLLGRVERQVVHQKRTRAHEAHVALQHVPQFGQFIERAAAQKAAEFGEPLSIGKRAAIRVNRIAHGAELGHLKRLAMHTGTRLAKKNG